MNTSNSTQRNLSPWLMMVLAMASLPILAGCISNKQARILGTFSRLEKEAAEYGTVSAGAARVTDYDDCDLEESRGQLMKALRDKRDALLKDPNMRPQAYLTSYASKSLAVALNWLNPKGQSAKGENQNPPNTSAPDDPAARFQNLAAVLEDMMKSQTPQPSETELIGLRMAALKFIESELEELKLGEPADPNYRRVVLSLDMTAWVRGKAEAALVYIDLYPYRADNWCHKAAKTLMCKYPKSSKGADAKKSKDTCPNAARQQDAWRKVLQEELGLAFRGSFKGSIRNVAQNLPKDEYKIDLIAYCHGLLARYKLLPSIVKVERMGQAEYLVVGKGDYSGAKFQAGGALTSALSGTATAQKTKKTENLTATVRPLSLAFVAGQGRAGWLLRPSQVEGGRMRPTERRLRMVVDVPTHMEKMAVHIHKVFLDGELEILGGADFKNQMANLDKTRRTLVKADKLYKIPATSKKERTSSSHYRLIKSRMRNLLHQGWSEEIVVSIPKYNKNRKCPEQDQCKHEDESEPPKKPDKQDQRKEQYSLTEQYTREEHYKSEPEDKPKE